MVHTKRTYVESPKGFYCQDITDLVKETLQDSGIKNGIICVHSERSVAAVVTMEFEPGCVKDFETLLEKVVPIGIDYEHHRRWHDGNGHSHMRSTLVGPGKTFPIIDRRICLEPWMQIVFVDFQPAATKWELAVVIVGE
ncbi:MAG: YjbQ family protein [Candidatus Omnitrophica bacterium]|nr:YjbQ family protein [Candidatus Omnitrophota bacterium]